jgi:glycosyltransferase involved in cell wall biosynthesis
MGSEWGLTWNWALHLSALHDVWALAHPEHRAEIDDYLTHHPVPTLRFVWVTVPRLLDPWVPEERRGSARLHYLLWQREAFRVVQRLHSTENFDVIHQVSWASIAAPPLLWRLPPPFVWGPVGGGQRVPLVLARYLGKLRFAERIRSVRLSAAPYTPGLRRAVRFSAGVIATNQETADLLARVGAREIPCWPDAGVDPASMQPPEQNRSDGDDLLLHWCGRLESWKGLGLALEALSESRDVRWRLIVSGTGPRQAEYLQLAARLKIADRVVFQGAVSRDLLLMQFREAHAFLFTSLRDSFGYVVLDALSQGLPVITLAHQGVGTHVPSSCAFKIPVSSAEAARAGLAHAVEMLARMEDLRQGMARNAWEYAATETWDKRAQRMTRIYEAAVSSRLHNTGTVTMEAQR